MKQVVILVRRAPLNSRVTSEALRVALGMTLADHQVTVLYIDGGAGAAAELQPELIGSPAVGESLSLFAPCNVRQVVEAQSLKRAGVERPRAGVEVVDRVAAVALISAGDTVLGF